MSYLRGIADEELFDVVTTAALVSEARKFDVSCEARAPMSIDDTLISGPTRERRKCRMLFEADVYSPVMMRPKLPVDC